MALLSLCCVYIHKVKAHSSSNLIVCHASLCRVWRVWNYTSGLGPSAALAGQTSQPVSPLKCKLATAEALCTQSRRKSLNPSPTAILQWQAGSRHGKTCHLCTVLKNNGHATLRKHKHRHKQQPEDAGPLVQYRHQEQLQHQAKIVSEPLQNVLPV